MKYDKAQTYAVVEDADALSIVPSYRRGNHQTVHVDAVGLTDAAAHLRRIAFKMTESKS